MKVTKIAKGDIAIITMVYFVTLTPNWFEKLFGVKEKIEKFKKSGYIYTIGNGIVYIRSDGKQLNIDSYIGKAIDKWNRSF